jgi:hypothetical protein
VIVCTNRRHHELTVRAILCGEVYLQVHSTEVIIISNKPANSCVRFCSPQHYSPRQRAILLLPCILNSQTQLLETEYQLESDCVERTCSGVTRCTSCSSSTYLQIPMLRPESLWGSTLARENDASGTNNQSRYSQGRHVRAQYVTSWPTWTPFALTLPLDFCACLLEPRDPSREAKLYGTMAHHLTCGMRTEYLLCVDPCILSTRTQQVCISHRAAGPTTSRRVIPVKD